MKKNFTKSTLKPFAQWCVTLAMALCTSTSLSASYQVETIAGSAGVYAHADGIGVAARFKRPGMMSIDLSGNLLVPDDDNNIRKISTAGGIYNASTLFNYNVGAPPVQAVCSYVVGNVNSILTTDQYSHLFQWIKSGETYVYNTSLHAVSVVDGYEGYGLVIDSNNNIFMTDSYLQVIYKIEPNGSYSIFVGERSSDGSADGAGSAAKFNGLTGITIDSSGNLYVSDTKNNTIRKITPAGVVSTIAGLAGSSGSSDGVESAARFNSPWDIDIDASGNLYVVDQGNNTIRKLVNNNGTYTVSTIAGLAGSLGSSDGAGSVARFNAPTGLAVDVLGNIYVSDTNNNTIRRLWLFIPNLEVDFTTGAELAGPVTGKIKFTGNTSNDAVIFSGSATADVEVTQGKVSMSSSTPIASAAFMHLNGGNLVATAGFSLPSLVMDQNGSLEVQTTDSVTLNRLIGAGVLAIDSTVNSLVTVTSDLSANMVGGINVKHGSFYVNSGKTPNAPLTISSGATLQLNGNHNATACQVTGPLTVNAGGTIAVDASVKVGADLTEIKTYSFDTNDGYFKSGSDKLPWPTNFVNFSNGNPSASHYIQDTIWSIWRTDDTSNQGISYGDVSLEWINFALVSQNHVETYGQYAYYQMDSSLVAVHPTISIDAALVGAVSMQSGSKIQLGANAILARDVTVTA